MNNFRTMRGLMNYDVKTMSEFLYFEIVRLIILYKIYDTAPYASDYAKRTVIRPFSVPFSMVDTDLKAILVYFNNIDGYRKLNKKESLFLSRLDVDVKNIMNFVKKIQHGMYVGGIEQNFLMKLERNLHLDSPKLRAMSILARRWDRLSSSDMLLLIDKMDNYGSLYLRHSELTRKIHKLKKEHEQMNNKDNEDKEKKSGSLTLGDIFAGAASVGLAKYAYDSRKKTNDAWEVHRKHNRE